MKTRPLGAVAVECLILRMGCPAQSSGSEIHTGDVRVDTSRIQAESARLTMTVGEFASGCPPKSKTWVGLIAARVCQANAGPWEELSSCQGGDWTEKDDDKER